MVGKRFENLLFHITLPTFQPYIYMVIGRQNEQKSDYYDILTEISSILLKKNYLSWQNCRI